uniref:Vacuolar protein sorting-associated protein 2 homolog 2-like n=1 Tax=Nicotiana tabacum TaxID=4097 RepID=A0A1S4DHS3_TOBAC|nr:PREDICTED: vacuolar protein sorting-associated protein 2 homolog 2-like [Nicotiana tabacum]
MEKLNNIFKKKTSPKEALRTSKREMAVATRGIEREISSLQMEEKKLVAEIKKTAKTGNEASVCSLNLFFVTNTTLGIAIILILVSLGAYLH